MPKSPCADCDTATEHCKRRGKTCLREPTKCVVANCDVAQMCKEVRSFKSFNNIGKDTCVDLVDNLGHCVGGDARIKCNAAAATETTQTQELIAVCTVPCPSACFAVAKIGRVLVAARLSSFNAGSAGACHAACTGIGAECKAFSYSSTSTTNNCWLSSASSETALTAVNAAQMAYMFYDRKLCDPK